MGAFEFMDVLRKKNDIENLQRKIAINFAITNINDSYVATIRDQYEDLKEEYEKKTISVSSLRSLLYSDDFFEFDNECFDRVNPATNLPYGYKLIKTVA